MPELVRAMAGRPRHEALRGHMTELLRSGFGAPYDEIDHEVYLLDGRGRIDTMWGATVIELKSDLRRELDDVLARLPDYLADAASRSRSPRPVTGLATDGATFIAYRLRDGRLHELARYATDPERHAADSGIRRYRHAPPRSRRGRDSCRDRGCGGRAA